MGLALSEGLTTMRMILDVAMPNEPFNSMAKAGTIGQKIQEVLAEIKAEAVYFTERDGARGALVVVDVPDASAIPRLSEPFFLTFDATVQIRICMTAEDLGNAGLDDLGKKYA
jgi:hypothetical protein